MKIEFRDLTDAKLRDDVASWPPALRDSVKSHFNRVAVDENLEIEKIWSICYARGADELPGVRTNQNFVLYAANEPFKAPDGRSGVEQKLERWSKEQQEYQRVMRTGDPQKIDAYHAKFAKGVVAPDLCCAKDCKAPATTVIDGKAYCDKHVAEYREQKVMA